MKKYVVFDRREDGGTVDFEVAHDEHYIDDKSHCKLSVLRLLFYIIFERGFLWKLTETIKYAVRHHGTYCGEGTSEVILFTCTNGFKKMWKKEGK